VSFAATNYLGLNRHPRVVRAVTSAVSSWGTSLGMPRILATDRLTTCLERKIARLVGQERALVFPSTTHVALDLLPLLAGPKGVLLIDEHAYPISLEGARHAAQRGARIQRFVHNDPHSLERLLYAYAAVPDKVVVCDGVYPASGHPATLHAFNRLARAFDAIVYVDDAHGVGVLGEGPTREMPYGRGGGGTIRHLNEQQGNIAHVGGFSKAFGVPIAFVAGPTAFVDHLGAISATFTHSSPPALPMLAAALAALHVHECNGEALRRRLVSRVRRFRASLAQTGIRLSSNNLFPVQTLRFPSPRAAERVGRALRRAGIWGLLQLTPPDHPSGGVLRFVLTAQHTDADIDRAVATISSQLACWKTSAIAQRR
jgi:8-amino-7-oxononanoate synthase